MPSWIKLASIPEIPNAPSTASTVPATISAKSTSLTQSVPMVPTVAIEIKYTSHMTKAKIGSAKIRLVTTVSIRSETAVSCSLPFCTHSPIMPAMY